MDLFATRLTRQLPTFYSWRPDRVEGSGCPGPELEPIEGVRTPSLVPDRPNSPEGDGPESVSDVDSTSLAEPTLVLHTVVATNRPSTAPYPRASNPTPLTELQVAHGREPPTTGCMEGLRRQLSAKGAPGDAADLIFHSWRTKTNSNYNSAWRKWAQWCSNREENHFSAPIASFLGFLAHQFSLGREYRSLNVYRSAISSTHLPVDGFPVRQHPLVSRLLKGVFNTRPPRPRYTSVWDVSHVTDFLKSMGEPKDLPVPLLTKKLAMLLALVSAQRSSDLVRLSLPVTETSDGVKMPLTGLAKQSVPGKARGMDPLCISEFRQEGRLCPVKCLKEYIARTEAWRKDQPQLFLAMMGQFHPPPLHGG